MKPSISFLRATWLAVVIILITFAWGCSDSTSSYNEDEIDASVTTRSGKAQGLMLQQEALFTILDEQQLSSEQERQLSGIRERSTTAEVNIARLAKVPESLLAKGKEVVVSVSLGKQFVAVGDTLTRRGPADISWAGPLQDGSGWTQLVLTNKGITGWLRKDSLLYKFEPLGGDLHALIHIDNSIKFSDQPANYPSGALIDTASVQSQDIMDKDRETFSSVMASASSTNSGSADIGLLVVYTPAAENAVNDIDGLIQTAIDETNQSYTNSVMSHVN